MPAPHSASLPGQPNLFGETEDIDPLVRLPEETIVSREPVDTVEWNINNTIPELSYLTHNYFRYYGKFPSVIPRKLIKDFGSSLASDDFILDNYMGSGTTLVEARLAGRSAVGIDLNPLGVLAARVKTRVYDIDVLHKVWTGLRQVINEPAAPRAVLSADTARLEKWFSDTAQGELAALKAAILGMPCDEVREFFTLAFFAVVRRVSRAYDGEVRPHINPKKKQRSPIDAFSKKVTDMFARASEFNRHLVRHSHINAYCADNKSIAGLNLGQHGVCGMIITHPPYLNCFDYFPVYSLEFLWIDGFDELVNGTSVRALRADEIRSWPATDETVYKKYFDDNRIALAEATRLLKVGGLCCVVIGDATIHKRLIPVHREFMKMLEDLGLEPVRLIYRSTHYGTGKYAYAHRSHYHGDAVKKRDGILVYRKL